jgi:hypothetical protein
VNGVQLNATPPAARLYEFVNWYVSPTSAWTDAELLEQTRASTYIHQFDGAATYYYWASCSAFDNEESVKFPNSDYTDVAAGPDVWGLRYDATFDLSDQTSHYWNVTQNDSAYIGVFGPGNAQAMRFLRLEDTHSSNNNGPRAQSRLYQTIPSDKSRLTIRYKVHSNFGQAVAQTCLQFGFYTYKPGTFSWPTDIKRTGKNDAQTPINVGQVVFCEAVNSLVNDTGLGNWGTLVTTLDLSTAITDSDAVWISPVMIVQPSESLTVNKSYEVLMDISLFNYDWY